MLRPFVAAEVSGDWERPIAVGAWGTMHCNAELKAPLSIQSAGAHDGTRDQALWDHRSEPCVFLVFSSGGIPLLLCVCHQPHSWCSFNVEQGTFSLSHLQATLPMRSSAWVVGGCERACGGCDPIGTATLALLMRGTVT